MIDEVLGFKIVGIGRRPMLIQCRGSLDLALQKTAPSFVHRSLADYSFADRSSVSFALKFDKNIKCIVFPLPTTSRRGAIHMEYLSAHMTCFYQVKNGIDNILYCRPFDSRLQRRAV